MSMSTTITAATALAAVNVLLLLVLTSVWVRNYRQFASKLVLGLIAFGVAMLAENGVAIYFFLSMQSLYAGDPHVGVAVLVLRAIQFVAVALLTYVTWR
jgi:hypothetical protein